MKTKKEHFASTDEIWENFWNWWEKQYNILMNELFGIKWVDTKWMSKRLLVVLIVAIFYGICKRIFNTFDNLMYPQ